MSAGGANPASIRDLHQWVCWRSEVRERDGKQTKIPYSPATGVRARATTLRRGLRSPKRGRPPMREATMA